MAKVYLETHGCSASYADSEMISGILVNGGHTIVSDVNDSDLNILVTCSVKDATANKMIYRIRKMREKPLVVAGCLPKAEKATVEKISDKASMMGPNSIGKTLEIVSGALRGNRMVALEDGKESKIGLPKVRLNPTVGIIEIASGCMSECTFCQTKLAKGGLKSYRIGDIVRQVKHEVHDGCKEVWLTSTDNGCYGFDIDEDLPTLLNNVAKIEGDFMIRVGMMNPMYMPRIKKGLMNAFESPKVFKFLHVPVQSGSNRVLNDMKRGHTAETFRKVVRGFRSKFSGFTISTDIIVGFPTENEEDFEKTVNLLEETRPDIINLSRYSQRPGTEAAEFNQLDVAEVKRRSKIVAEMADRFSYQSNKKWIGWKGKVLFDEKTGEGVKGRNFAYKPVYVNDDVKVGQKAVVEIDQVSNHCLIGRITTS